MPIPQEIIETLAIENLKTVGGSIAAVTNLAFQNAVSNQQTVNGIMAGALGKIMKDLTETDVSESLGLVALGQQSMKGAQTTPPVTP